MDHTGHPNPDDCAASEYYEDPKHRVPVGSGRKQKRTRLPDWLHEALIQNGWTPPGHKTLTGPAETFTGSFGWPESRRLDQVKSIRLSSEEMAVLEAKANAAGCSASDLIREAIGKLNPVTLFIDGRRVS